MKAYLMRLTHLYALQKGRIDLAFECLQKSMEIFKKLGDRKGIGISLGFLGDLYTRQGDLDLGMDYCQKGLEMIVST